MLRMLSLASPPDTCKRDECIVISMNFDSFHCCVQFQTPIHGSIHLGFSRYCIHMKSSSSAFCILCLRIKASVRVRPVFTPMLYIVPGDITLMFEPVCLTFFSPFCVLLSTFLADGLGEGDGENDGVSGNSNTSCVIEHV